MAIAATLGLLMMNLLKPGDRLDDETSARLVQEYSGQAQQHVDTSEARPADHAGRASSTCSCRSNLFGAFVGNQRNVLGDVLPLILFAILVGAAGLELPRERRQRLLDGLETVNELMTGIVHFALKLAPYAVPAMIFSVVVKVGFDILMALGLFVLGCGAMLLLHLFGTMSIWLKFLAKRSPREFFRDIKDVLVTAFSTSSSSATLPAALAVAAERLGISPSTAGFVLPLGTTMNMSGTALYEGCVVLFVAQVFGVHLGLAQQVTLVFLSVLSAVAVAAIPGGSLPLIAGLLVAFGIPPEGIGIILGVDRLLDMTRTMTNVGADLVTTAVVDARQRASGHAGRASGRGASGRVASACSAAVTIAPVGGLDRDDQRSFVVAEGSQYEGCRSAGRPSLRRRRSRPRRAPRPAACSTPSGALQCTIADVRRCARPAARSAPLVAPQAGRVDHHALAARRQCATHSPRRA